MTVLGYIATAWLIGAVFTWWRTTRITTDSPGLRFLLSLVLWPFLWGGL